MDFKASVFFFLLGGGLGFTYVLRVLCQGLLTNGQQTMLTWTEEDWGGMI